MRQSSRAGFTLIEMIMTIIVLAVLGAILANAFFAASDAYVKTLDVENAMGPMRTALTRMTRDIREIRALKDITAAPTAAQLQFLDLDGNSVAYSYSSGTLSRNGNALISGLSAFSFTYQDVNGTAISSPAYAPSPTDIRLVQIDTTAVFKGQARSMRTTVCPRTFRD